MILPVSVSILVPFELVAVPTFKVILFSVPLLLSDAITAKSPTPHLEPRLRVYPYTPLDPISVLTAAVKTGALTQVGDTITEDKRPASEALPGCKRSVPVVFCGLFPVDSAVYEDLRDSLAKLHLNDASFHYEAETSAALGLGYRCGFLGLLHLEIIQQRLENPIAAKILAGKFEPGDTIKADYQGKSFVLERAAMPPAAERVEA